MLLSILVFGFLASSQVQEDARQQIRNGLLSQAAILKLIFTPYLRDAKTIDLQEIAALVEAQEARITLIDADGLVLADNRESPSLMANHKQRPEIAQARLSGVGDAERFSETVGQNLLYLAVRVEDGGVLLGYVRLAVPTKSVAHQLAQLRNRMYVSAAVITAIFLVFGFLLSRMFTGPIVEITSVASRIANGEFDLRLPSSRQDEIGEMALALNALAQGAQDRIVALTGSHDQMAAVLSGLNEGVIAVDLKQRIVHINSAARQLLKLEQEQVENLPLWEVVRISEICHAVDSCMGEQVVVKSTVRLEGTILDLSVLLMRNQQTKAPSGAIIVLEDFTDMVRLQQIRTDFVANASHELKTPIAAIRGFAETILDDPQMEEDTRLHFMDRIRSQASRLDNIVQDLIHLSRFDSPVKLPLLATVDLGGLLRQVYQAKSEDAEDAGVALDIDLPTESIEVHGEHSALDQMVSNLLDNAIKYSRSKEGRVHLRLSKLGETAVIEVEDNGIGIPDGEQQRIFERFYRIDRARSRDQGGTGLGLSIVKHVAQSHKGSVSVHSNGEQGTIFSVRIPVTGD